VERANEFRYGEAGGAQADERCGDRPVGDLDDPAPSFAFCGTAADPLVDLALVGRRQLPGGCARGA
jgi:hypothetical protein